MILKGKLYGANEALKLGLVDEVVPREQLLEAAKKKLAGGKRKPATPSDGTGDQTKSDFNAAPDAPSKSFGLTNRSMNRSPGAGRDRRARATDATKSIRNFFLADKYRKGSSKTPVEIVHAAVIGAGVMGSGSRNGSARAASPSFCAM